jgi:hypothetical protein
MALTLAGNDALWHCRYENVLSRGQRIQVLRTKQLLAQMQSQLRRLSAEQLRAKASADGVRLEEGQLSGGCLFAASQCEATAQVWSKCADITLEK